MNEYVDKIVGYVMQGIACVGGIGSVIAIITTIIKTFGSNSVKVKLAANKAELNETLDGGLNKIKEKINTDITVNISYQVNEAIERATRALRNECAKLEEEINVMRIGLATIVEYEAERNKRLKQDAEYLMSQSAALRDVKAVEHNEPATASITLESEPIEAQEARPAKKVVI